MKALGASYSNFFLSRQREKERAALCSTDFALSRHEFGFLLHQNQKCFKPNCVASISSSQTNLGSEEIQTLNLDRPKTVRVRFKLHKECAFGQQFLVVGDDPSLGLWDPCDGVPLIWSEGHVWTAEVDLPCSKVINYKFILEEIDGAVSWQPGPDRVLEIRDTDKVMSVSEDWDVPDFQNIVEEEFVNDLSLNQTLVEEKGDVEERVDVDSLGLLIAENWNGGVVEEGNGVMEEQVDGNERRDDHSDEPSMVAENISEEQDLSMSGKTTLGDDDTVVMNGSESSSLKNETKLVIDEGVPVLVPGLATLPSKEVEVEETETEASSVVRTTTEVFVEFKDSTDLNQRNNEIVEDRDIESDGIEGSTDLKQRNNDVTTTTLSDEIKDTPTASDEIKDSTDLKQRNNDVVEDTATASEETDLKQRNSDVTTTAFDGNEDTSTTVDEIKDSTELNQRNNDVVEDTPTELEGIDLKQRNNGVTATVFDEIKDSPTTSDEIEDSTDLNQRNNDVVEDTATESEETDPKQINNAVVEDTATESDESAAATKPEIHVPATLHHAETSEMKVAMEEEEPRRSGKKQILVSDMQWGRRTLHKFLAKIGFMQHS